MKASARLLLAPFLLLTLTTAWAEEGRVTVTPAPREPIVAMRVGVGSMVSPEIVGVNVGVEGIIDRFLSIGPMVQAGFGRHETLLIPTLGLRLTLPRSVMKERQPKWPDLEFSLHTGFGTMVRDQDDFRFYSFAYEVGANGDYYVTDRLAVGLGATAIVTSSMVQTGIGVLYASLSYSY